MQTAFNVGDAVLYRHSGGFRSGRIVDRRVATEQGQDGNSRTRLLVLIEPDSARGVDWIERDIRSCCAMIHGPHVLRAEVS